MDSPQFKFVNNKTLIVINTKGKIRQMFTPFNTQALQNTEHFKEIS